MVVLEIMSYCRYEILMDLIYSAGSSLILFFSSPEPKAPGELIV